MEANFIEHIAPQRIAQRGYDPAKSNADYTHLVIPANQTKSFDAYNQLWYLVGDVEGLRISSTYGDYDLSNFVADEQQHEHTDQIEIKNLTGNPIQVRFYKIFLKK